MSDDSLDFNVNLNNFSGSLEILLDLAKSQKVDLEKFLLQNLLINFINIYRKRKYKFEIV